MNEPDFSELYRNARWRADEPEGGWPESFGVVTAWNPGGKIISEEENVERTEALQKDLADREIRHFPVTGYDLESDHYENGFGIACDKRETIRLGREWKQLAVFWVEEESVWLIFCEPGGEEYELRPLGEMLRWRGWILDGGPGEP